MDRSILETTTSPINGHTTVKRNGIKMTENKPTVWFERPYGRLQNLEIMEIEGETNANMIIKCK